MVLPDAPAAQVADEATMTRFFRRLFYRWVYLKLPHWQRVRKAALKRAGYRCEWCGVSGKPLDVHHLFYHLWREKPGDLMVLCRACHERKHKAV